MNEEDLDIELPDFFKKPKKAHLQFFLLMLIQENPTYGYEIIKKIEKRTFGKWKPSHSAIYNLLNTLTEKKFIKIDKSGERDKKIYKITEKGEKLVEIFRQEIKKLFHSLIQTMLKDEEFEIPPMIIKMELGKKGTSFIEDYPKEEQIVILKRFKKTLNSMLDEVEIKIKKLKG
ncbi:MAG: PadR family transcriptional regulator [Candidatus Helarchaeota archaeon]